MPFTDILPQLLVNGLIAGAIYALAASGFSLVYYVLKFQYFSQGAIMTIGAYSFFAFFTSMKIGYVTAGILSVIVSILAALITNWIVYRPLRRRKATPVTLLITSIVLLMFSSSLILALFGSSAKTIPFSNKTYDFGMFTITLLQIWIIASSIVLFFALWLVLKFTRLGKAMRAIADNKDVAQIIGINPEKIYTFTFVIASVLGAFAGILLGLEQNLYPRMGVLVIVKGFIGAVVGGITSVPGSIIGGLTVGVVENIGIWFLPSGYKDVISFTILLVFLLLRPQGIFGVRLRDDS
ncbi:MAG: branched-chain amino acid ABC transporter permease [Nanoarchaeota archaeon]